MSEREIAEIFAAAYSKAGNIQNAVSGYAKAGLHPYNPDKFTDEEFVASELTDIPLNVVEPAADVSSGAVTTQEHQNEVIISFQCTVTANESCTNPETRPLADVSSSGVEGNTDQQTTVLVHRSGLEDSVEQPNTSDNMLESSREKQVNASTVQCLSELCNEMPAHSNTAKAVVQGISSEICSFADLIPIPKKLSQIPTRKRKVAHAEVITASPYKNSLLAAKSPNSSKPATKPNRRTSSGKKIRHKKKVELLKKNAGKESATNATLDSDDEPLAVLRKQHPTGTLADNTMCKSCRVTYGDPNDPRKTEEWFQCDGCSIWLHESCAELFGAFGDEDYLCKMCL